MKKDFCHINPDSPSIKSLQLFPLTTTQIHTSSILKVETRDLYDANKNPILGGVLDTRLGLGQKGKLCGQCNKDVYECFGHIGHYELSMPLIHPGFLKKIIDILRRVCIKCAKLNSAKLRNSCNCKEKYKIVKNGIKLVIVYQNGSKMDLSPNVIMSVFERIDQSDYEHLDLKFNPANLLVKSILVPPCCIRPSVNMNDGYINEDDLTIKLSEIIHTDKQIRTLRPLSLLMEDYDFMQTLYNNYNSFVVNRLKGKQGRFRGNLMGKRVDFTARTVITPDPYLSVDQVGIPIDVARVLTVNETVTNFNIERLRKLILNGTTYPGVNYLDKGKFKQYLKFGNMKKVSEDLKVGDIVERHIIDGDIVLFNRQPSLHKLSIMGHKAKIHKDKTFKLNECICTPYGADFDGDEMNVHALQTYSSRVEANELMALGVNMLSPRNGQPVIGCIQDFVTGAYLLTSKNCFLRKKEFVSLLFNRANNKKSKINTLKNTKKDAICNIKPTVLRPLVLYTGKQCVEYVLQNLDTNGVTFISKNKGFKSEWDFNDGFVVIINSRYLFGRLDKSIIGTENKGTSLIHHLIKIDPKVAMQFLNNVCVICALYLTMYGFSIGYDDLNPNEQLLETKSKILNKIILDDETEDRQCFLLSGAREECGKMFVKSLPTTNAPKIMAECGSKGSIINISQMIALVGQQIIGGRRIPDGFNGRSLPHFQKSSEISICNEVIKDKEEYNGELDGDKSECKKNKEVFKDTAMAKGFVRNSFRSGLNSFEFFFHAVSGREGLVDTAVKTAETGYMQRRLMKALEDVIVCYDGTVWNKNRIVQFLYGDDGFDPTQVESIEWACETVYNSIVHSKDEIIKKDIEKENSKKNKPNNNGNEELENISTTVYSEKNRIFRDVETIDKIKKWISERIKNEDSTRIKKILNDSLVDLFVKTIEDRFAKYKIDPCTAAGALCGQSIGEPGTQMTLKTFHFAGVSSMNITLGVPRLKEIINAVRNISTPIIKCFLLNSSLIYAKKCKGYIDKILFKDVLLKMTEIYCSKDIILECEICVSTINTLFLNLTIDLIYNKIKKSFKTEIKTGFVNGNKLTILINNDDSKGYLKIKNVKRNVLNIIISNIPTVERVIITKDKDFLLLIEGTGLKSILGVPGVDTRRATTNNILEIFDVLGVEAARQSVINELKYTMESHGIVVDIRHLMLLSDVMTMTGEVLGITRFGIKKFKTNSLMLASFEETGEHLFKASIKSKKEVVDGVSESILVGKEIAIGTGMIDLFMA